jgi:uncharacterized damage-inducible protein DinB
MPRKKMNSQSSRIQFAQFLIDYSFKTLFDNIKNLSLREALFIPGGGYRSILGLLKHTAGWSHVYHSFAFETNPHNWREIDWPRSLRDTIEPTKDYLDEVISWLQLSQKEWISSLQNASENTMEDIRSLHWGEKAPLYKIIIIISNHNIYHVGEINYLLSITRGEAWEEGEEVEENHISTMGHRVKPPWL